MYLFYFKGPFIFLWGEGANVTMFYAKRVNRDVWGVEAVDPAFGRSDVNERPLTDG